MHLPLTEPQREHLRNLRTSQLVDWRSGQPQIVDDLFIEGEVVRLMSGMGRAAYLGLDGRVWVGNLGEGELPQVLDDPKEVASVIVRWADAVVLPELVEALPAMPDGGEICSLCKGTREMPEDVWPRTQGGVRPFCQRCGGLGWTRSA